MKKTNSMRVAGGLLALTLMTSCFVGGTFAKYITKAESDAGDLARVAKWGVTMSVGTGDLFDIAYEADGNTSQAVKDEIGKYSVKSEDADLEAATGTKVVAPGTSKEGAEFFTLAGTPEVAVNVKIEITGKGEDGKVADIVLPAGTYKDYTTADPDDVFTTTDPYYPVEFTLTNGAGVELATGNLQDIVDYLTMDKNYAPNTDLSKIFTYVNEDGEEVTSDGTFKLSWKWAYGEFDKDAGYDQEDTYLGQVAAMTEDERTAAGVSADVNTAFDFALAITVTQID